MSNSQTNNYVDVYEQVIDEDPGDDSFEVVETQGIASLTAGETDYLEDIEEEAYEDLANSKRTKMVQSGGGVRTQEKRPFSQKLIKAM